MRARKIFDNDHLTELHHTIYSWSYIYSDLSTAPAKMGGGANENESFYFKLILAYFKMT